MKRFGWKPSFWSVEIILWLMATSLAVLLAVGAEKNSHKQLDPVLPKPGRQKPRATPTHSLLTHPSRPGNMVESPEAKIEGHYITQESYGVLPLRFEKNHGQAEDAVRFLSRGTDVSLFLTDSGVVLQWRTAGACSLGEVPTLQHARRNISKKKSSYPKANAGPGVGPRSAEWARLKFQFEGILPGSELVGEGKLDGQTNYIEGNEPKGWRANIPNFSSVRRKDLYPGIDVTYYGQRQKLEYDIIVKPGADPRIIRIAFADTAHGSPTLPMRIDSKGTLRLVVNDVEVWQKKPRAYQVVNGRRRSVKCDYVLHENQRAGFLVQTYDPALPLVIDPVISYTITGLGGTAITVDPQGNAYIVGEAAPNFVTTPEAFQSTPGGGNCVSGPNLVPCSDILIAKLNSSGTDLVYATFLGGRGSDYAYALSVDEAGNAYITGSTGSPNFPTTIGSYQPQPPACLSNSSATSCYSAFVTKLNTQGSALVYSTYLSGSSKGQAGNGIAVDPEGNVVVTGDGESQSFVTKLDKEGKVPVYTRDGIGGAAVALDTSGNAYVLGRSGNASAITKLSRDGRSILYSYRLSGTTPQYSAPPQEIEALTGIAVDTAGSAYVTGFTAHKDFPTTPGVPFPNAPGAGACGASICRDAIVAKLNKDGTALAYSTYLGGNSIDYGTGIAVDFSGNAYVSGYTRSTNFPVIPVPSAIQPGGSFVAKLDAKGTKLIYSQRLGDGSAVEGGNGISVDSAGSAYVTGYAGPALVRSPGAYQPTSGGNGSFVSKIFDTLTLFVPVILASAGQNDAYFTSELTLTNRSATEASLEFNYSASFGGGSGTGTDTLPAGQQVVIPDAISYLRSRGVPIPESGNRVGTLAISFHGLSSPQEGAATIRTTTAVTQGRAGLAYSGVAGGLNETVYLCGLRHNSADRTNVAIQNAGTALQGEVVLRLTVFSSDPGIHSPLSPPIYEATLSPGEFKQFTSILQSAEPKIGSGFVKVERIQGSAPFYAYAVINDQSSLDGSFVPPISETALIGQAFLTLPVIVESGSFDSELVLTNWAETTKQLNFEYAAEGLQTPSSTAQFSLVIKAHEQILLPNVVQWMRSSGVPGLPPGRPYVGPLFVSTAEGDLNGVFVGARTSSSGPGGRYGVFYSAVSGNKLSTSMAWLFDLQQSQNERSNIGLVNTGDLDSKPDVFRLDIFDGETGLLEETVEGISVNAGRLVQLSSFLAKYAPQTRQGYTRITRISGKNSFVAYSVINDGGQPGQGSGDGAFVSSSP